MDKENQLFTYKEYGYTPHEYFDYRFEVTKNHQCGLTFLLRSTELEVRDQTAFVSLNPDEVGAVSDLCMQLRMQPEPQDVDIHYGSSYSVILHGETDKEFKEDTEMKKKADQVVRFIRSNHEEELGSKRIASIYCSMMEKFHPKEAVNPATK